MSAADDRIPTLNINDLTDREFIRAHGEAYERFGFCGIVGHGIDDALIEDAYRVMRAFFSLPDRVKARYLAGRGGARGYTRFGVEKAKDSHLPDLKEFWHVGREIPAGQSCHESLKPNVWPTEIAGFRTTMYGLFEALDDLGNRVLDALALYLGLEQRFFRDKMDHGNCVLRPLHYPPIREQNTRSLRAAAHEDINLITLLVGSEEPGLEILTRQGEWIPVTSVPGAVVVNIGDMMQRLTNHVLPSTTHRVVNSSAAFAGRSRFSIPFFCHPNPEFLIATLPGCISPENPNRYPEPITADDYLTERLIEINLLQEHQ